MNILVVHPYMGVIGGAEKVAFDIINTLVKENDITLVSDIDDKSKLNNYVDNKLVNKINLSSMNKFYKTFNKFTIYRKLIHYLLNKKHLVKNMNYDVEIITEDVLFTINKGKYLICYVHYPEYFIHLKNGFTDFFWSVYYFPIKLYIRSKIDRVDLFLCNSEFTKKAIKNKWNKNALVIYPSVDVDLVKPLKKEKFVVTVGRFDKTKNYEFVLDLAKKLPEINFYILGKKDDPEYFEFLNKNKTSNVFLRPNLDVSKLYDFIGRAKIYLHTMRNEHFGISIIEAMAGGCVPLVHNSGGQVEAIENVGYKYNNVDDCASLIGNIIDEEIDINIITENAKKFDVKLFSNSIYTLFKKLNY